jgi:hypothetical protein
MDSALSNRLKKEILEKVKIKTSQVHLYLKVAPNVSS